MPGRCFLVKHSDTNYTKSSDFKNKALVIIDSKEVGNVGNKFIEDGHVKYSTITIYNPSEAKKIFGDKGQYGAIKLTQKEAVFISAKSIYFDDKSGSVKLLGPDIRLKGDFSDALINVEGKIITAEELKTIDPNKISSVSVLQGDKLNDITEAKGKKSVIYISLKADDLPEVVIKSSMEKTDAKVAVDTFDYYKAYGKSQTYKGQKIKSVFIRKIDNKAIVELINGNKIIMTQQ